MAVKKGQSTRDKFFLDFVAGATQLSDPFGKERSSNSNIDWLPSLAFDDEPKQAGLQQVIATRLAMRNNAASV